MYNSHAFHVPHVAVGHMMADCTSGRGSGHTMMMSEMAGDPANSGSF